MDLSELFAAVDAAPFRPFRIEIVSGRQVEVSHPDNIIIIPSRQNVKVIQVFHTDPWEFAIIWPDGIAGLFFNGGGNGSERA